ncbi:DUF2804 domain-containing protein [Actinoplanes teichomyceticus]|uniref:Uncharacterized protein DUF2804 n=1 Tax=Actinoplanes teichomyceticus TaxID=1867 RepID=A0A561WAA0_ACTTI|nr:DUF2804 domain-containing protein [Actinoplanes teichomyceticus]TWG20782.1 uncharacterized protein DUF2804 [Actinoplanes teichomyceticus]GIF14437.1 hypothetical protein Ate01nite_44690 [Actinoplanes teichomyceticus]
MTHEIQITEPVDLCLPDGRLNPAAVGWSRRPLHRANLPGWGRNKRWEYWGVVTPAHILGVVVASLDYAGVHGLYLLDRVSGRELAVDATVPLARGVVLPDRSGSGRVSASGGGVTIAIDQAPDATTLRASARDLEVDLTMPVVEDRDSLGVVVAWSRTRFQYTVKDVGRPVHGRLVVRGVEHAVPAQGSYATLDHGRGRWPYSATWNWAAGAGEGRAIQLGGTWTDGTGTTENGVFEDGRLHKIGSDLRWEYDRADRLKPWRITGPGVDVSFQPFHERVARTGLGLLAGETHQCFGRFAGWARAADGHRIDLDGLTGWAEETRNRW